MLFFRRLPQSSPMVPPQLAQQGIRPSRSHALGRSALRLSILWLGSLTLSGCTAIAIGKPLGDQETGMAIARHYFASQTVLVVDLPTGSVDYAKQVPYQPQPGDSIKDDGHDLWLERNGTALGNWVSAVGQYNDWDDGKNGGPPPNEPAFIYGFDRYIPPAGQERFDPKRSEQPQRYRLSSNEDPAYKAALRPQKVFRKSRPVDMAQVDPWNRVYPVAHSLYFQWPKPLTPGKEYRLETTDGSLQPLRFRYAPDRTQSEAIHISQIGFRPDEPKLAFLSTWMGSGGGLDYDPQLKFQIIDQTTARSVYQGKIQLRRRADEPEDPRGQNYNGTAVYAMAFDGVSQAGNYQLCVETVGCSATFAIGEDAWKVPFMTAFQGFYYQRSGIALNTALGDRPRPFSQKDGQLKVYQSKATLMETGNGLGDTDNFSDLVAGKTDQVVADAWGGYFDAADWDRRIQHLDAARLLLELAELFPERTAQMVLNPLKPSQDPSQNAHANPAISDIVDESLWGLDVFRRMQLPDGGIRGGIESAEHPRRGETSWQESWSVMAYAPDVWSSYVYAGVAARAAFLLKTIDPSLAQTYRASAEAAMAYGERQPAAVNAPHAVNDARNLAALELWRLTQAPP
jgi:endoglucanase